MQIHTAELFDLSRESTTVVYSRCRAFIGLFGGNIGLFCKYGGLFCGYTELVYLVRAQLSCAPRCRAYTGLTCVYIGLICVYIGLFCGYIELYLPGERTTVVYTALSPQAGERERR